MSDDWDTVTKIGSKTGGGSSQRETVVRGKGALNQAQRTGAIIGTEKKFATGNTVNKAGSEGQRLTKVDRSDDIVAPQKVSQDVGTNIRNRRSKEGPYKMTQAQLAQKVNAQANDIKLLESGDAIKNQGLLNRVARVLKISPKTGLPLDDK
ncbi:multiprotein-bridging factor 1 [Mycoblastus sanguinarius]|nr:multiprotein-bridging factor 1 [Mycoblastus sanguinarius]